MSSADPVRFDAPPLERLDLECDVVRLNGALHAVAALVGAARTIDATPGEIGCLIDLLAEKSDIVRQRLGF